MFYFTGQVPMNIVLISPPPTPLLGMQEDETDLDNLRNVLEKDVITAWHSYMGICTCLVAFAAQQKFFSSCPLWLEILGNKF